MRGAVDTRALSGSIAVLSLWAALTAVAAEQPVGPMATPGFGSLTTCRSWIVYSSCDTRKVVLPERVNVGDELDLSFGSNNKQMMFHIARIDRQAETCTLLREAEPKSTSDRIEVNPCRPMQGPVRPGQ